MNTKQRVLIVEDEIVVALFLEDVLAEFGYEVAGVVSHLDEAMAREPDYDIAVLDVHINGRSVFDFADLLAVAAISLSSLPPAMANAAFPNAIAAVRCCRSRSSPKTSGAFLQEAMPQPGRKENQRRLVFREFRHRVIGAVVFQHEEMAAVEKAQACARDAACQRAHHFRFGDAVITAADHHHRRRDGG